MFSQVFVILFRRGGGSHVTITHDQLGHGYFPLLDTRTWDPPNSPEIPDMGPPPLDTRHGTYSLQLLTSGGHHLKPVSNLFT